MYGYLPAISLLKLGDVLLPMRYRNTIIRRSELCEFLDVVRWRNSDQECLQEANCVVVATSPSRQLEVCAELDKCRKFDTIILEKPIATTPEQSVHVLERIILRCRYCRINYSFADCQWTALFFRCLQDEDAIQIVIRWSFRAHHFITGISTWKQVHVQGGGALRFYGIHIIALLARCGYTNVTKSSFLNGSIDASERWNGAFEGLHLPPVAVQVDTNASVNSFNVDVVTRQGQKSIVQSSSPFNDETKIGNQDQRVGMLCRWLRTIESSNLDTYSWYRKTNLLWAEAEEGLVKNC
jgi:hypothetical protein